MPDIQIHKKLGLLKPDTFKKWFADKFPVIKDEWQSYYETVGGKIRKGEEDKK